MNAIRSTKPHVLLVDDDPLLSESLGFILQNDFQVSICDTRAQVKQTFAKQAQQPCIALIDLGLPPHPHLPDEGFALIADLLHQNCRTKVLVLSGQNEEKNIEHALTLGAVDFIEKPTDPSIIKQKIDHHLHLAEQEASAVKQADSQTQLIGNSAVMHAIKEQILKYAQVPFPVLVEGESGVGKELVTKAICDASSRSQQAYIVVNCAAIAPELLESILFGHAKGAFTGAHQSSIGFFEQAQGGTLVLDEVGELPLSLQGKLLRVLENGEYYRVGETQIKHANARILASTNKNLFEAVNNGHFRRDLYHRLSTLTIKVPPLRARSNDVFALLDHFQALYGDTLGHFTLDDASKQLWAEYDFPGNIRELKNIVIRLGTKYPNTTISPDLLKTEFESQYHSTSMAQSTSQDALFSKEVEACIAQGEFFLDQYLENCEKHLIELALNMPAR